MKYPAVKHISSAVPDSSILQPVSTSSSSICSNVKASPSGVQVENETLRHRVDVLTEQQADTVLDASSSSRALAENRIQLRDVEFELHCAKAIYTGGRAWQHRSVVRAHRRLSEARCMQELQTAGHGLSTVELTGASSGFLGGAPSVVVGDCLYSVLLTPDCSGMAVSSYNITTGAAHFHPLPACTPLSLPICTGYHALMCFEPPHALTRLVDAGTPQA